MSVLFMLTISFPESMLMAYFVIQFMGGRPRLVEIVLIGLIQSVVAYIVRDLPIPVGMHTIMQILSYVVLLCFIARVSLLASSIGIIIGVAFYLSQEIITGQILLGITGLTMQAVVNHPYMRIFFFLPSIAVMLSVIAMSKKYNINFGRITSWDTFKENHYVDSRDDKIRKEYLPLAIFIFLPVLLLFVLNFTYVPVRLEDYSGNYSDFLKILINGLIIFLAFVSVWALRRISRSIEEEYEAKKSLETIEQLKELILSIRKQRHDFNNHLQAVYGLIETGSYEKARDYIQNTYHYVTSTGELIKTDNPSISALLYTKIIISETRSIKFGINIDCSLEEFPLNSNESTSVVGNLIDNAFDAVEKLNVEQREVNLSIYTERGNYFITVSNIGEIEESVRERLFETSVTTKNGHAGLGLTIIREIVDRYKGNVKVENCERKVVFILQFPIKR